MYPFLILFIELIILPLNVSNILLRHVYAVFPPINAIEKMMTSCDWAPLAKFDGAYQKNYQWGLQNGLTKFGAFVTLARQLKSIFLTGWGRI